MTMIFTQSGVVYTPEEIHQLTSFADFPVEWWFCQTAPDAPHDLCWTSGVDWEANNVAIRKVFDEHWCSEACGCWEPRYAPVIVLPAVEAIVLKTQFDRFRSMNYTHSPEPDPDRVLKEWADGLAYAARANMDSMYMTAEERQENATRIRKMILEVVQ